MLEIKKSKSDILPVVITIVGFALLIIFVISMLTNASATSQKEALQAVQDSVSRAVVSCYAYEGFYPDNVDYLVEWYNLSIDNDRYLVYYDKIADNLMPTIVVLDRNVRNLYEDSGEGM